MDATNTKRCCACHQELPLSSYGRDKHRSDGLRARCRSCENQNQRDRVRGRKLAQVTSDLHAQHAQPPKGISTELAKSWLGDLRYHPKLAGIQAMAKGLLDYGVDARIVVGSALMVPEVQEALKRA